jgi:DNA primase
MCRRPDGWQGKEFWAWAGATVSTPLKWSEVRRGLDPSRLTIRTMPERLAKVGDLWAPVLGPGIDLAKCVELVANLRGAVGGGGRGTFGLLTPNF